MKRENWVNTEQEFELKQIKPITEHIKMETSFASFQVYNSQPISESIIISQTLESQFENDAISMQDIEDRNDNFSFDEFNQNKEVTEIYPLSNENIFEQNKEIAGKFEFDVKT